MQLWLVRGLIDVRPVRFIDSEVPGPRGPVRLAQYAGEAGSLTPRYQAPEVRYMQERLAGYSA